MKNQLETIKNKKRNGFTLVELIVVMAIIGILAAIAIPNYTQYVQKAKNTAIESDGGIIQQAALTAIIDDMANNNGNGTDDQLRTAINSMLTSELQISPTLAVPTADIWTVSFAHTTDGTGSGTVTTITVNGPSNLTYTGTAGTTTYVVTRTIQ